MPAADTILTQKSTDARPGDMQTQKTGNQSLGRHYSGGPLATTADWAISGGGLSFGNGGSYSNPMNFPGWGIGYNGTNTVYRWMLQNPIIRLVRSICMDIILSSTWEYEPIDPDDKVPDRWKTVIKRTFDPIRRSLLKNYLVRAKDFGWAGGEIIWEERENYLMIKKVKPLLQDVTQILQDEFGEIVGLRNGISSPKEGSGHVDITGEFKSFVYTYDGEAGNPYGRSWLENIRATAWMDWMDCAQQLARLGAKISGVVTIIKSPAGTFPGPPAADGTPTKVSYKDNAESVIKALAGGASGVWFPSLGLVPDARGGLDAMKVLVELAGKSLTNIEVQDFGSNSAAIGPILDRMKHAEELMFAGGLRSSRTGLEGTHGTKEEAGVHTDTGTMTSESEDEDFAEGCQPLVDAVAVVNFGPKAKGRIRIKPPSLVDRKAQILRAILLQLMNHPETNAELARTVGVNRVLETLDVPTVKEFDPAATIPKEPTGESDGNNEKLKEGKKTPDPEGGRPANKD